MNFDTFRNEVWTYAKTDRPTDWRRGQAAFNYIEQKYHVARQIQFEDGIDCFYDDSKIDDFIIASYRRLCGGLQCIVLLPSQYIQQHIFIYLKNISTSFLLTTQGIQEKAC